MIQRSLLRQSRAVCLKPQRLYPLSTSRSYFPPVRIVPSLLQRAPRCYSTTTENTTSAGSEAPPTAAPQADAKNEDPLQKELESKNREIIELKDKYLRSVAEFRNLQDRTKRDIDSARSFAISRFGADLIESVDNLDRALGTVPAHKFPPETSSDSSSSEGDSNAELINLYQGLKMTERILMQTLKKHGVERFDPAEKGEVFNPNLHEATFQTKVEGKEDGTVFTTMQKGFSLNGRVVRAAKVGVVKNS